MQITDRQDACSPALSESMLTAAALKTKLGKFVEVMQTMCPLEAWGGGLAKGAV